MNGHVAAGSGHDREGQLVETDPFAERHHVRSDIGFGDNVCAVAQIEIVGVRTAAAVQGVVALARRDELISSAKADAVVACCADDMLDSTQ